MNFYIAAEIENFPVLNESWKFSVGDSKKTGNYVNKELEKGQNYIVYERALTKTNEVCELLIIKKSFPQLLQLESSYHLCG